MQIFKKELKKIGILFLFLIYLLPVSTIQAQTSSLGFIPANIWYSKDPFEEGDKIKIYTFIFNPEDRELSGTVAFYDDTTLLGKKNFVILPKGVKDISIDWTVSAGEHTIFGKIESAKLLISAGKYESVSVTENKTDESIRQVKKKIIPKPSITENKEGTSDTSNNLQSLIKESTPTFISKPIILVVDNLEEVRENTEATVATKKEEVKKEIEVLKETPKTEEGKGETNVALKPWKYVELFFLTILHFALKNKIIFYIVLAIPPFLLLRFIWRKIF